MTRIAVDNLTTFTAHVLESLGTTQADALCVAEHLVGANLTGHDSHGVLRLESYCRDAEAGHVNATAQPRIERETPTTAVINGCSAWGPIVARYAMEVAIEKARKSALSAVAVHDCYHVGRVGVYPLQAAQVGYIGLAFCNVHGSARAAPWGATGRRMATNPIAVAVPRGDTPILTDFATTAVAEGKVRAAQIDGRQVPEGWVLDAKGDWSRDPNDLYGEGSLAPLGGDQGHKGYSLSVAIDLLSGVLSGDGSALMETRTPKYGNGLLFQVIDPAAFTEPEEYQSRIDDYERYVKTARRLDDSKEILLPGEIETRREQERRSSGISIPDNVWRHLMELAEKYNVVAPQPIVPDEDCGAAPKESRIG